jgi:hypothetical protein
MVLNAYFEMLWWILKRTSPAQHMSIVGIFYNTLLLSRVYEQKVAAADLEAIEILKGISPVAWRNINLIGNFDFTTSSTRSTSKPWQPATRTKTFGTAP